MNKKIPYSQTSNKIQKSVNTGFFYSFAIAVATTFRLLSSILAT